MSRAHNPYGDGLASNRIVDAIVEQRHGASVLDAKANVVEAASLLEAIVKASAPV
jgi:hypothetical protein